jgi:hypothetical protein
LVAHGTASSFDQESTVGLDARRDALAEVIAGKQRKGYWVESQSDTEARLIARGGKRWFGLFGGRVPETREIVRVDEQGRPSIERLPARRY